MFSGNVGGIGGGNTAYDIDRLKNQITEQKSDLSQKESDKSQTTTDLSTATSEETSLQTSLSEAESAISSASSALSSAKSARSSAESIEGEPIYDKETGEVIGMDFSKRDAAIAEADAKIAEAQAQYDAAVQNRDSANQQYQNMLSETQHIEAFLSSLDQEIYSIEADIQSDEAEVQKLEAQKAQEEQQVQEEQTVQGVENTQEIASVQGSSQVGLSETEEEQQINGVKSPEEIAMEEIEAALDAQGIEQLNNLAAKYTNKEELTQEEYGQIIALEQIFNNYDQLYAQFGVQLDSEGTPDDIYNAIKDFTGLGITREMVEEDFCNYAGIKTTLQAQLNGDTKTAQETVDAEFERRIKEAESLDDCYEIAANYYGNPKDATKFIESMLLNIDGLEQNIRDNTSFLNDGIASSYTGTYKYISPEESESGRGEIVAEYYDYNSFDGQVKQHSIPCHVFDNLLVSVSSEELDNIQTDLAGSKPSDFNSMYKFWTGVDYDQEKIQACRSESTNYTQVNMGLATAYQTEQMLANSTPQSAFDSFLELNEGDEEKAIAAFNNYYETLLAEKNPNVSISLLDNKLTSIQARKNEEGELEFAMRFEPDEKGNNFSLYNFSTYNKEDDFFEFVYNEQDYLNMMMKLNEGYDQELNTQYQQYNNDLYAVNSMFGQINRDVAEHSINQERFKNTYQQQTGRTTEEVIDSYNKLYEEAFGESEVKNTLDEYMSDMESYAQKLSTAISITSIGASFFCPAMGIVAIAGTFVDNGIEGWRMVSNDVKGENWQELVGETFKEAAFIAIGMGIGKMASSANKALSAALSNGDEVTKFAAAIGTGTEVAIDGGLGLTFDYLTTGDLNLTGNGLSVFIDIMSGIRGYKAISAMKAGKNVDVKPQADTSVRGTTNLQGGSDVEVSSKPKGSADAEGTAKPKGGSDVEVSSKPKGSADAESAAKPKGGSDVEVSSKPQGSADGESAAKPKDGSDVEVSSKPQDSAEIESAAKPQDGSDVEVSSKPQDSAEAENAAKPQEVSDSDGVEKLQDGAETEGTSVKPVQEIPSYRVEGMNARGLSESCVEQLNKLDDNAFNRAIELLDKGVPQSRVADAAVLTGEKALRVDSLISDGTVSPYYIGKLAALDTESFDKAMRLIKEEGFTAPSALDVATKTGAKFDAAVAEIKAKPSTMKAELTPEIEAKLLEQAEILFAEAEVYIKTAKGQIGDISVDNAILTARSKGVDSTLAKLVNKFESGKLKVDGKPIDIMSATPDQIGIACKAAIGDSYGTRLQLPSLEAAQSRQIIQDVIDNIGYSRKVTPEQLIDYITTKEVPSTISKNDIDVIKTLALDSLKEAQTQPFVDKLVEGILDESISITELNNYGNDISSYFTQAQIYQIAEAYEAATGKKLPVVSKFEPTKGIVTANGKLETEFSVITDKGAVKDSGYTSSQMNVTHDFGSTTGNGELQVRGTSVNDFGDAEHIPYDIRQGKITPKDTEYATVYSAIKNMDKNSYTRYNEYLSATYDYLRLQELGITVIKPELTGEFKTITGEILSQEQLDMLSMEGLTALYRKIHPPK